MVVILCDSQRIHFNNILQYNLNNERFRGYQVTDFTSYLSVKVFFAKNKLEMTSGKKDWDMQRPTHGTVVFV